MEVPAKYEVVGQSKKQPKLEKTIVYVEAEELEKLRDKVGTFNQKTKQGGISEKVRDLIGLYNERPEYIDSLIRELKSE